jgi:hypothetical protein
MPYVHFVTMLIDYTVPSCDYIFPQLHVYFVSIAPHSRY